MDIFENHILEILLFGGADKCWQFCMHDCNTRQLHRYTSALLTVVVFSFTVLHFMCQF